MAIPLEILVLIVLVLFNGVLAGAEIALVSLRPTQVEALVEQKRAGAAAVRALRNQPERLLATIQVGITVIGASAGAFGGASLASDLEPLLRAAPFIGAHAEGLSFAIVVGAISYFSLVLGELVPKSLALRVSERYALLVARPLLALAWLARPAVWLLTKSSNLVLRPFGDSTTFSEARLSVQELRQLVDDAASSGALHAATGEIAARALELSGLTVADVMVPRAKVIWLPRSATLEDVRRIVLEHGKARLPVLDADGEQIAGYVTLRDLVALLIEDPLLVLDDLLRPAYVVPRGAPAADLLVELQSRELQLALVVDERGAFVGIVTLEDLVEELVGEIRGEHEPKGPVSLQHVSAGIVVVRADMPIRELNRALDLSLPTGETWSTVAGLVLELAGRIPDVGERFEAPDGTVFEVLEGSPQRIERVRVSAPSEP